ncbi:hypothetical protein [Paenibacillus lutimineralis]|uniref:Copper amine oxidase-like N-terminal domain-containing protein n=1 Tax=Paenibacillus lutimineralis TaxID=2707005 RepID=A0A3Q9IBM4_9BACL|nr:hypothetical protein [Paenibacillus lutimineralis]AZS14578.1 hypothetical protein EI981_09015 [Paenibacillus lutimineralis]
MKKFVVGFIAGALIFSTMPAFADSIQSIFGAKVTGVYTIQNQDGKKIAEGAILNGSTYVPVRAMSKATGTPLTVDTKKKVITLGTETTTSSNIAIDELNIKKEAAERKITSLQGSIKLYESDIIPNAQKDADNTKGTESEATYKSRLDSRNEELAKYKADLAEAQRQLAEIELQITEATNMK